MFDLDTMDQRCSCCNREDNSCTCCDICSIYRKASIKSDEIPLYICETEYREKRRKII